MTARKVAGDVKREVGGGGGGEGAPGKGSSTELTGTRAEKSQGRRALSPKQGPPDSKTKCSHRAKTNLTRRAISSQQPPKIKMATSLENVKRSLGGSAQRCSSRKGVSWPATGHQTGPASGSARSMGGKETCRPGALEALRVLHPVKKNNLPHKLSCSYLEF